MQKEIYPLEKNGKVVRHKAPNTNSFVQKPNSTKVIMNVHAVKHQEIPALAFCNSHSMEQETRGCEMICIYVE
jgi:hypothetical protein